MATKVTYSTGYMLDLGWDGKYENAKSCRELVKEANDNINEPFKVTGYINNQHQNWLSVQLADGIEIVVSISDNVLWVQDDNKRKGESFYPNDWNAVNAYIVTLRGSEK